MAGDGKTNAAWSTTEGKHVMTLREAIMHLPEKKPHVVAGQIHDDKGYVILIRLEGNHLFVDRKNDKNGGTMTKDYKLGDVFAVQIVVEAGHVKTFYNGGKDPVDDFAVEAVGCYFKAGCYTQSNMTKDEPKDSFGQVAIYEIKIEHTK
jgi:poly(beta-D-mannuronate) lyase